MSTAIALPWDAVPGLKSTNIGELAKTVVSNLQTIKAIQAEVETQKAELEELLTRAKVETAQVDEIRVTLVKGKMGTAKLDTDRLLKLGVAMSTISAATIPGKLGKPYIKVTTREEAAE